MLAQLTSSRVCGRLSQWRNAQRLAAAIPSGSLQFCAKMSSDEVAKSATAVEDSSQPTIFAKIANKEIPADIIHEDDKVNFQQWI